MALMASVGSENCTEAWPLDLPSLSVARSTLTTFPATLSTSFNFCQETEKSSYTANNNRSIKKRAKS